jgi:ABC-type multidrug transport system permease subunit
VNQSPLYLLTLARIRLFFREPSSVFWSFGFPIVLSVALGIAFRNRPPEPVRAAIEAGPGAQELAQALQANPDVRAAVMAPEDARTALRVGKVSIVVAPGSPRSYEFDPARPESRLARALVDDVLQRAQGRTDPVPVKDHAVTEIGSRYIDFLVPGLLGVNIMSAGMWGIGYVIVETRTRKLLKRMVATPMRRSHFLLSFVLMRLVFLLLEVPVLLGFAWLAFGVTVRGSLLLLSALTLLGALAFSGIGLLVASRAQNTQTVGGLINVVMMPMFIGSGVFFSAENFPSVVQPLIKALPLTALNDSMRAVINEGASMAAVLPQVGVMAFFALVSFGLALKWFRWS